MLREVNFDGIVGPTHNYGGLSQGNIASTTHGGEVSNPREAALQGLTKMRFLAKLGVGQAVLPPQPRPSLRTLRRLGFAGSDEEVIAGAARHEHLLRLCSSAAAMWTANAATVAPSTDTADGRLHVTPANLQQMYHRSIEADTTHAVLRAIFRDPRHFEVHDPLPGGGQLADEGAANHTRLSAEGGPAVHLFGWGRSAWRSDLPLPKKHPARQTLEASEALARLHKLSPARTLFPRQDPEGIDGGAFHSDVLAVGNEELLLLHERAFAGHTELLAKLRELIGPAFRFVLATEAELPVADAVSAYPFNSQVVTLPDGTMSVIAPTECDEVPTARRFLERVIAEDNRVTAVRTLDLRQSMRNGGGPACLRLRIALTDAERAAVRANVFLDDALHAALTEWVGRHYRDRLVSSDLADPALARATMTALDELTRVLRLGSVYDFQQNAVPS